MKRFLFAVALVLFCFTAFAQSNVSNPDSAAYQNQRKKINALLAQRVVRFGQYDASLSKHTGIFGLQTKKDIRRSNGILMDILANDNNIFRETKVLLAFKNNQLSYSTYQQQTVQSKVKETEDASLGFMTTINKLRVENEKLKVQARSFEKSSRSVNHVHWTIMGLMAASILFLLTRKRV